MSNSRWFKPSDSKELTEEKAFAKILRLATASEQSSFKLRDRLLREGYEPTVIEAALSRAVNSGVVCDSRYAEAYVRSRLASGRGCKGIGRELEEIGLSLYDTEAYRDYAQCEDEQELDRAIMLLDKKPPRSKNLREGAFRKLIQQGYSVGVASSAARIWLENKGL